MAYPPPPPDPAPMPASNISEHPFFKGIVLSRRAHGWRCKLRVFLGPLPVVIATLRRPSGPNKHYSEASGIHWQCKTPEDDRWCALGFYGPFGWVHRGMVHRCSTTDGACGADAVRARGATTPTSGSGAVPPAPAAPPDRRVRGRPQRPKGTDVVERASGVPRRLWVCRGWPLPWRRVCVRVRASRGPRCAPPPPRAPAPPPSVRPQECSSSSARRSPRVSSGTLLRGKGGGRAGVQGSF